MRQSERLLLASQTNGEIVQEVSCQQGAGSGDGCPDGSGKVLFRNPEGQGPSWTRRQNAPHRGEPEDPAGSEALREGGLADSYI